MDYIPVLSVSAHHALADGSHAPQAAEVSISTSGLPAYSPTWDHGQCNMTSRPSECRADHQEAACVKEESDMDRPDGDQLAQISEVMPSYAPGVCGVMCSCVSSNFDLASIVASERGAGKKEVYFMALVDVLTHYGVKKRTAQAAKTMKHGAGAEISTVHPEQYAKRFLDFISKAID
ncbi:hypothetical protein HPB51_026293 [Rhipicephalus microplus]|uniref:PIPK domain-containing protein n=1 Tax=Rhipicephalus microplus TaxID=6941 RepID=A0A9J6D859_RHIMP|nr:hypothetical protein HPB51_026293 [Rhipicephalus microplus]